MFHRSIAALLPLVFALPAAAAGDPPLDTVVQRFSYGVGLQLGHSLSRQGVTEVDPEVVAAAIAEVLAGKPLRLTREELMAAQRAYLERIEARKAETAKANLEREKQFLEGNRGADGVTELDSGVQYRVLEAGPEGTSPQGEDTVVVNYRGTSLDGVEFDSSQRHGGPSEIQLGRVIEGWREVLPKMKPGDRWEVWIPSRMAYGENGAGAIIGPNELLHFEIELVEIKAAAEG